MTRIEIIHQPVSVVSYTEDAATKRHKIRKTPDMPKEPYSGNEQNASTPKRVCSTPRRIYFLWGKKYGNCKSTLMLM